MTTPFRVHRRGNRGLVIRRRRQCRTATVVFFTAAVAGPIVAVPVGDDQPSVESAARGDAVSDDGPQTKARRVQ